MNYNCASTKEEIISILKRKGILSASEISKEIGITEMAVRRHLNTLEREELVRSSLIRQAMGRPINNYFLTDKADDLFPKAYKNFAKDLLSVISDQDGSERVTEIFNLGKEKYIKEYQKKIFDIEDLKGKINALIRIRNEKGYIVELEETENGYIIKQYNCLITEIAIQFRQACEVEKQLYSNVLERDIDCINCLADGDKFCAFFIKK